MVVEATRSVNGAAEYLVTMGFMKATLLQSIMARTYFYLLMGGQIESVPGHLIFISFYQLSEN